MILTLEERCFLYNPNEATPNDSKTLSICEQGRLCDKILEIAQKTYTLKQKTDFKATAITILTAPSYHHICVSQTGRCLSSKGSNDDQLQTEGNPGLCSSEAVDESGKYQSHLILMAINKTTY